MRTSFRPLAPLVNKKADDRARLVEGDDQDAGWTLGTLWLDRVA